MKLKIIKWLEGTFGAMFNGVLEFKENNSIREKAEKTFWIREITLNLQIRNPDWDFGKELVKDWKKDLDNLTEGKLIEFHAELSDIFHSRTDLPSKNAKNFLLMLQLKEETEVM